MEKEKKTTAVIRTGGIKDAVVLSALSIKTFYDSFAHQNTAADMDIFLSQNFSVAQTLDEIKQQGNIFLLAEYGNNVVGYAKLVTQENAEVISLIQPVEISRLYVTKDLIGQGIGAQLMQACINIARELKCKTIWLGVWENNLPAINFYKKWGYEIFGNHIFQLGNDPQTDILLKKDLE